MGLLFFLCLSFLREQATRQGANHHTEIESHLNSELPKKNLIRKAGSRKKATSQPNKSEIVSADRLFQSEEVWRAGKLYYQIVTQNLATPG